MKWLPFFMVWKLFCLSYWFSINVLRVVNVWQVYVIMVSISVYHIPNQILLVALVAYPCLIFEWASNMISTQIFYVALVAYPCLIFWMSFQHDFRTDLSGCPGCLSMSNFLDVQFQIKFSMLPWLPILVSFFEWASNMTSEQIYHVALVAYSCLIFWMCGFKSNFPCCPGCLSFSFFEWDSNMFSEQIYHVALVAYLCQIFLDVQIQINFSMLPWLPIFVSFFLISVKHDFRTNLSCWPCCPGCLSMSKFLDVRFQIKFSMLPWLPILVSFFGCAANMISN